MWLVMWLPLAILAALVVFDLLVLYFGIDSRPGFSSNPERQDIPRRSI